MKRLVTALLAVSLPVAAANLDPVLSKMDSSAAAFQSMTADIQRVSHTAVINTSETDEGNVRVKRAGKNLRMVTELVKPDPKFLAVDGSKAELFLPKLNRVEEYDLGKNRGMVEQFFLLGFGTPRKDIERDYTVKMAGEETVAGERATKLELTPKSSQMLQHLKKAELWINSATGYPVQQKFYQAGGDYHLVTYTNLKINPAVPDSSLKLKLPKGVERVRPQK
jgi:outer membrane lipoprotein-sorting protein